MIALLLKRNLQSAELYLDISGQVGCMEKQHTDRMEREKEERIGSTAAV